MKRPLDTPLSLSFATVAVLGVLLALASDLLIGNRLLTTLGVVIAVAGAGTRFWLKRRKVSIGD